MGAGTRSIRAIFADRTEAGYELRFVDSDQCELTFEEARDLGIEIHDDFSGPFASAANAIAAVDDFVSRTPGCEYRPNLSGEMANLQDGEYAALWDRNRRRYIVDAGRGETWWSSDGDEWTTEGCQPITSPEYESAKIRLIGGPRDGDVVR